MERGRGERKIICCHSHVTSLKKEAMTLHNLWITDMGQWYFQLAYFNTRWLQKATRHKDVRKCNDNSKQIGNMQHFPLVYHCNQQDTLGNICKQACESSITLLT